TSLVSLILHVLSRYVYIARMPPPSSSPLFPYTTLFRSLIFLQEIGADHGDAGHHGAAARLLLYLVPLLREIQDDLQLIILHHGRSEEHTSELQSRFDLVCRLLLEKKKLHILT